MTVEQRKGGPANLTPSHIDTTGVRRVKGIFASATGINFNPQGQVKTYAAGSAKVSSSITTRAGGRGHIKAEAPGQAAVHVRVKGDAQAEVTLTNRYPDLGHAKVESVVWGKGMSFSTARGLSRRSFRVMILDSRRETDVTVR